LWEEYEDEERNLVHTFTIITTSANEIVSKIHDRMPVILNRDTEKIWLNNVTEPQQYLELLKPYSAEKTEYYSVSSKVNSPENNQPELILPAPPADQFGNYSLFD
jgi:putative SOS response-associated peptidase YedK